MPPPREATLVRYDNPITAAEFEKLRGGRARGYAGAPGGRSGPGRDSGGQRQGVVQTQDILNSVFPPREWDSDGQKWVQQTSAAPATRLDVINLQERLDAELKRRQARDTGVCEVRAELYEQTFDELIRQVAVDNAERGLLLLRARDDLRHTVQAYRTLFDSSVAFGTRKAMQAEQGKTDMQHRIRQLERRVADLEVVHHELQQKCDETSRDEKEKGRVEKAKFEEEFKYLKNANQQLGQLLQTMIHGKGK
eukprot:TRINITY_DN5215_c0_g1_i1.p2 TRINITY_DN5215_c0_g1~~TRINITY_DN5215_c0_g1_i1.p2  ORF type:complete len:251 (+),score=94.86 TRINITY_DN5215_c0_g1_i1:95-847(+)